ncbi:phage integrase [Salmonella enterica]|uniref:phage integrase n=1 Tax=Salmonella enterica TaxID=28901 RepID=UPI003D321973
MSIKSVEGGYLVDLRPAGRAGKRIRKKFATKSDAMRYERWVLARQHNKEWQEKPPDRRHLSALIDLWWKYHGQIMKSGHNTQLKLLRVCDGMKNPCAYQINAASLSEYRIVRVEQGIKSSTINREVGALGAMFSALKKSGHFHNDNPVKGFKELKEHAHEMGYLSKEECRELLDLLGGGERLAVEIALSTGARWGEVVKLEQIQVRNGRITFVNTKNSKNRTVPVAEKLFAAIKERKGATVFPVLDYWAIREAIKEVSPGIPKGQAIHALRHTFASHFMMNGGNILTLQKILGHSKIQTTMIYAHLAPDYLQDAVRFNPLGELIDENP